SREYNAFTISFRIVFSFFVPIIAATPVGSISPEAAGLPARHSGRGRAVRQPPSRITQPGRRQRYKSWRREATPGSLHSPPISLQLALLSAGAGPGFDGRVHGRSLLREKNPPDRHRARTLRHRR